MLATINEKRGMLGHSMGCCTRVGQTLKFWILSPKWNFEVPQYCNAGTSDKRPPSTHLQSMDICIQPCYELVPTAPLAGGNNSRKPKFGHCCMKNEITPQSRRTMARPWHHWIEIVEDCLSLKWFDFISRDGWDQCGPRSTVRVRPRPSGPKVNSLLSISIRWQSISPPILQCMALRQPIPGAAWQPQLNFYARVEKGKQLLLSMPENLIEPCQLRIQMRLSV